MVNESGIKPVEYKVLIQMLPKETKTAGGLYLPEAQQERHELAREIGIFVIGGSNAFSDPQWGSDDIPAPGDKVLFDRYAGSIQKGKDGKDYRLCNDKELGAIVEADYVG